MGIPLNHPAIVQAVERGLIRLGGTAPAAPPALPPGLSEKEFQARVVALARAHGWKCYHTFDARRSGAGWPDLALCRPGALVLAELKADAGAVRPEQAEWLGLLGTVPGLRVRLWRPADWPAITAELTAPYLEPDADDDE